MAESLFYYFRIEDHVPEQHLLRAIDHHLYEGGAIYEVACWAHTRRMSTAYSHVPVV
jgi:hypothetical protein